MRVNVIHPSELGSSETAAWHLMQKATPVLADPFLTPEYAMAVGRLRPQSRVAVLQDGQNVVGFFPFEVRRLSTGVPISGWLSSCQGVVHAPDVPMDIGLVLRRSGLAAWRFDNLVEDPAGFRPHEAEFSCAPTIDLTAGFDAYWARLREQDLHFCKEIERKTRKLSRDRGEVRLEADCRDPAVLDLLMRWKSEQYQQTNHVDRFARPWVAELLHATLNERNSYLTGMLSVLYSGDQPVAIQLGLRTGGLLSGWFTGYDQEFNKYSPGLIQLKLMTEALRGAGIDTLHMGKGAKSTARAFKTGDIQLGSGTVTAGSALGHAHRLASDARQRALQFARKNRALHEVADVILRRTGLSSRFYGNV
jgi:CelD/BcsL family acetyltransferase involved in cellulose biosynthesis